MPRTLILRTDHLGDAILTTPLIRALAKAGHQVDFVIPNAFLELFEGHPFLHSVIGMETVCADPASQWRKLAEFIRKGRYDVLILPLAQPRELLWASLFSGVRRRIAVHSQFWGRLTGHECPRLRLIRGDRFYAAALLDIADLLKAPRDGFDLDLVLSQAERDGAADFIAKKWGESPGAIVGIHLGTGGNTCNPRPAFYQEVAARLLAETDWKLILTGSQRDRALLQAWDGNILGSPRVWNSMGELSLRRLGGVIARLNLYLCPSTGPLHIAAALSTPTLSPFCLAPTLCAAVWAPRNGAGFVIEPGPGQCANYSTRRRNHCDFSGKIEPVQFVARAREIVGAAGGSSR